MRQLLIVLAPLVTACAARTAAPIAKPIAVPTPEIATLAQPMVQPLVQDEPIAEVDEETPLEDPATAPYALVFHEGQTWSYTVASDGLIAMSSTQHEPNSIECRVAKVDYFCDRKISTVTCDGGSGAPTGAAMAMAGTYTTTGRGIWKASWNGASEQLEDKTRLFARYPESLVDGRGVPLAKPFHGGWCTTESVGGKQETICVNAKTGLTGGSIASADGKVFVGDVPRS